MTDTPTLFDGPTLRDAGLAQVESHERDNGDWFDRALEFITDLDAGTRITAEDVRAAVGDPTRPNAPGALMRTAGTKRLIVSVGYVKAERPGMHATDLRVWERTP